MAFYKGYVPNMLGIIPYAGIDLAVYEVGSYTVQDPQHTRSFFIIIHVNLRLVFLNIFP